MRNRQPQQNGREIPNYRNHDPSSKPRNSSGYSNVLQNVYNEEVRKGNTGQDNKLLIISVHAVFLESGFVCLDSAVEENVVGFHLPMGWESKSTLSIQYTLSHLLSGVVDEDLETVVLKFQTMGKFVYVHGSLNDNNPIGFIRLDASWFVPSINLICVSDSNSDGVMNNTDGASKSFHESEVFQFWKIVRDGLALHMLTDLCIRSGLEPPPCFTSLIPDLKLKILEFLPGTDLAKISCVSSELKFLSSNDYLWKKKYVEDFLLPYSGDMRKDHWKHEYITSREKSEKQKWFWPAYGKIHFLNDGVRWNRAPACILYAPSV